jgi:hypothetical protein
MQECSRVFPDGTIRTGFVNEAGTHCIIKVGVETYKYPITNPKPEKEEDE